MIEDALPKTREEISEWMKNARKTEKILREVSQKLGLLPKHQRGTPAIPADKIIPALEARLNPKPKKHRPTKAEYEASKKAQ